MQHAWIPTLNIYRVQANVLHVPRDKYALLYTPTTYGCICDHFVCFDLFVNYFSYFYLLVFVYINSDTKQLFKLILIYLGPTAKQGLTNYVNVNHCRHLILIESITTRVREASNLPC